MYTKAIYFGLITTGLLLGSTSLSFADHKTYAGAECERWNENSDPATFLNSSRRFNPSASRRLRLDCPSIKDRSGNIRASWIRVIDRHPRDRVCARMVAYRQIGAGVIARHGPARCTGTAWNSPNSVLLNTGGLAGIPSRSHYYHSVYRIPKAYRGKASGVVTYFVNEFNSAD